MRIQFNINKQKANECVLWFIQKGERDMYKIWKMLFVAEKYHLNKYGRPITGDKYFAMKHGTVPNWLYKQTSSKKESMISFIRYDKVLLPEREPIIKFFSRSDIKALEHGYKEYVGLSFGEVREKNHKEPAWVKNWDLRGKKEKVQIPFEDLIAEDWLKEDLKIASRTMVL